jgi:hypothetical protein
MHIYDAGVIDMGIRCVEYMNDNVSEYEMEWS